MKKYLQEGDIAFTTGAHIQKKGDQWVVVGFEDDTYFEGKYVENVETKPFVETE